MTTTSTAPAPLLPLVFFVTATMAATRAAFTSVTGFGLVSGLGPITRAEMGAACASVCEVIDLGGTRDQALAAIVETAYSGITTDGARDQARAEAETFLAWVESHADGEYATHLRGPWS